MKRSNPKKRSSSSNQDPAERAESGGQETTEGLPAAEIAAGGLKTAPGGPEEFRLTFGGIFTCNLIEIPIALPSLNEFFARGSFSRRAKLSRDWKLLVKDAVRRRPVSWPFGVSKVNVHITTYRSGKVIDSDNVIDKFAIDGLRAAKVIPDDDPRYVKWAATRCEPAKKDRTVIVIEAIE